MEAGNVGEIRRVYCVWDIQTGKKQRYSHWRGWMSKRQKAETSNKTDMKLCIPTLSCQIVIMSDLGRMFKK